MGICGMEENPDAKGFDRKRLQRIDDVLQADVNSRRIPGAVVLLARYGQIAYWKPFGFRDRDTNVGMQRDDLFRIASMTKPVTSVGVMMLAERGRILLPEAVAKYLPDFAETRVGVEEPASSGRLVLRTLPQGRAMTVYDLLRHTAGLTYGLFGSSLVKTAYNDAGVFDLRNTNEEMVRKLGALPLAHQPGRLWDYSMATDVLGRLLEVVSGKSLGEFFAEEILRPLGLENTGFRLEKQNASRMAQPQSNAESGLRVPMTDHTTEWLWESGGAGLYSTAGDYLRFCQMLLNRGEWDGQRLLAASTVDFMTRDHIPADMTYDKLTATLFEAGAPMREMGQSFGLGLALRTHPGLNPLPGSVGDYGWGGALGTYFWVDPQQHLIAIFMSQAPDRRLHYRYVMRQLVYQALEEKH